MFTFFTIPLSAYKNAGIGLLLLSVLSALGLQSLRLNNAQLKEEASQATIAKLNAEIIAQNAGIKAVHAAVAADKAAAAKAAIAAKNMLAKTLARVTIVEAAPVPTSCPDAVQFLVDDAGKTE